MKAIVVRSRVNRNILGGAIILHKGRVIPFMNPLPHSDFKNDNFKHYLDSCYLTQTLQSFKDAWSSDGKIFFQEVISNG